MIDLHLHLLPGVDDGAQDLEEAVTLCRLAAADGCSILVAAPHQRRDEWLNTDPAALAARLESVQAAVGKTPRLLLGAEVRVDSELVSDLAREGQGGVLPVAGSRYLLLELEPNGLGPDPVGLTLELRAEGWRPIIAHPELVPALTREPEILERLVEAGALLQVTAGSVTGDFGRGPRDRAWELLAAGMVHLLASDAHRPDWRPPGLSRARTEVARQWGESLARNLTLDNPRAVIEDREVVAGARREAM